MRVAGPFLLSLALLLASLPASQCGVTDYLVWMSRDYYGDLGLERAAQPSQAAIKKAYRDLALELHPDRNPREDAAARFRKVAEAYEVLKDAETRASYDEFIESMPSQFRPGSGSIDVRVVLVSLVAIISALQWFYWRHDYQQKLSVVVASNHYKVALDRAGGAGADDIARGMIPTREARWWDVFAVQIVLLPVTIGAWVLRSREEKGRLAKEMEEKRLAAEAIRREMEEQEQARRAKKEGHAMRKAEEAKKEKERERLEEERVRAEEASQREAAEEAKRALKTSRFRARTAIKQLAWPSAEVSIDDLLGSLTQPELESLADSLSGPRAAASLDAAIAAHVTSERARAEAARLRAEEDARAKTKSSPGSSLSAKPWTKEEVAALIKAFQTFPGGTINRFERISQAVGTRTPDEVIAKVKDMKKATQPKKD